MTDEKKDNNPKERADDVQGAEGGEGAHADFELYLAPTYDFVMKLLQVGPMIEVIEPVHLRMTMKGWIRDMYELYKND